MPAFIATDDLHPTLARVLALRRLIELRNPAHSADCRSCRRSGRSPGVVRVVLATRIRNTAISLGEFLALTGHARC